MKKTLKETEKQLKIVKEDLKAFWKLLHNKENETIYIVAHRHGAKLSRRYLEKVKPIVTRLKKFMGESI